jgi:hypothetical protein
MQVTTTRMCCVFLLLCRKEHKIHSPSCLFVEMDKKEADMTPIDHLQLSTQRKKNILVCTLCTLINCGQGESVCRATEGVGASHRTGGCGGSHCPALSSL